MKELHLICNAHLDPIWQWEWEEGIAAAFSTFNSAVNLAEKYDYIFCHNEAILYKYIEEYSKELFKKIKHLVEIGKWHIMGGWFLQPDCTMLSGESFVRQIWYGKNYFKEKFNKEPRIAVNFDSFGHTRGLVQILNKTGYTGYVHCRPNNSQLPILYGEYLWKGFDNSTIKVTRRFDYSSLFGQVDKKLEAYLSENNKDTVMLGSDSNTNIITYGDTSVMFWGVGNHGGGPSSKDLAYLEKAIKENKDIKILHSTPEKFFETIDPIYVVDKSLYTSMPGCYTTMSNVKHKHREVENLLYSTEKLASIASINDLIDYPHDSFDKAIEDLLTAEFHDTLPGTVIEKGEENAIRLLEHAKEELNRIKMKAFFSLTTNEKKAGEGEYPIFVYNFQPYNLYETIEVEFSLADQNWSDKFAYVKVYKDGNEIHSQQIKEESSISELDWRKKIVFDGYLEPLSINRFDIKIEYIKYEKLKFDQNLEYSDSTKKITIGTDGLLKSYIVDGIEYIKDGFNLYAYSDIADPWGMIDEYQKGVGHSPIGFSPLSIEESKKFCNDNSVSSNVRVIEDGCIIKRIESYFKYNNSFARLEYTIYKNHPYIDINVDVYNNEKDKMIRLHIPTFDVKELYGDTAFGTDVLFMDSRENVSQKFIYAKDKDKVLAIFNDGTYGSMFKNNNICISLLRSAAYCAHPIKGQKLLRDDRYTERIDQKKCSFKFRLIGLLNEENVPALANEFSVKPFSLNLFPLGSKNHNYSSIKISNEKIVLVAFKKRKDSDGYIIRLQNNSNKIASTNLIFDKISINLNFDIFEVKTLSFDKNNFKEEMMII